MKKFIVCLLMAAGCVAFLPGNAVAVTSAPFAMQAPQGEVSGELAYSILKYAAQELCVCENSLISQYENGEVTIEKIVENGESRYLVSDGGGGLIEVLEAEF